jgi:multidrug efflux pump subunit AcrA (membrane-fusion protein)
LRGGLPAHVHLDGYVSFIRRPVLKGTVTTVSADSVTDARSGLSYYTLRVAVPAAERERLKDATLQPGMPVSVMVKTGERSLMTYLLGPVVRRLGSALSEH